ncbi:helix-turn-helix domain-containing protein [Thermus hydrothermalis]|uniref:helix-turn-helix domain-containing protein n=1 Tax=Thermus hydrothermalis TaxID=2908148 RepID=UPI003C12BDE7
MAGVGETIKQRRAQLGLTQKELAARVGISRQYLAEIETGRRKPTLNTLERLFFFFCPWPFTTSENRGGFQCLTPRPPHRPP